VKTLIVDDDFTNRLLLQEILKVHGPVHVAVNGKEAVEAVAAARDNKEDPYDLICLDIMMPEMDGQEALKIIRADEDRAGVIENCKVIMTTALGDSKNVIQSFKKQCDGFIVKPVSKSKLLEQLQTLGLI